MERERQRPLYDTGEPAFEIGLERVDAVVSERDTWTGLYDVNGRELHRPRETIGFKPR